MDSLSFGIPNRFQKSVELTFNYSCSIIFIGHDEREIAVTIPRNAGHVPAKSPVTMARNTHPAHCVAESAPENPPCKE